MKLLNPGAGVTETLFTGNDPITSTNKSAFVHDVWRATDALSVITGVRYTKENKDYTFSRLDPYDPAVPSYNAGRASERHNRHVLGQPYGLPCSASSTSGPSSS